MSDHDDAIDFLLAYTEALHNQGVPAHRLEAAFEELAGRLGVESQILSTPTSIQLAFGPLGAQRTALIRVSPGSSDLGRLALLDEIGHGVFHGFMPPTDATKAVRDVVSAPPAFGRLATVLAYGLGSGAAARFFSDAPVDLLFGGLAGLLVGLVAWIAGIEAERSRLVLPLAGLAAGLAADLGATQGATPGVVVIAGILVLLPGLSLTTAMTELGTGNLVSGTARAAGAIVTLLELAFGVVVARQLAPFLPDLPVVLGPFEPLPRWSTWPLLLPMALSFHVLFGALNKHFRWVLMACVVAYGTTALLKPVLTPEGLPFVGAFVLTMLANAFARAARRPASVVLLPGILLIVPGSMGFRGVTLMLSDTTAGMDQLFRMAFVAVALAAGVLVANVVVHPRRAL